MSSLTFFTGNKYHFETPDQYSYNHYVFAPKDDTFQFSVKACSNVLLALSTLLDDTSQMTYEVHLGAYGDLKSEIRDGIQVDQFFNILIDNRMMPFKFCISYNYL